MSATPDIVRGLVVGVDVAGHLLRSHVHRLLLGGQPPGDVVGDQGHLLGGEVLAVDV